MRFYVLASLRMDRQTLGLHHLPMTQRLQLVAAKATALATLARHRPAPLRVGPITFTANSTLDLGSFQSCVVDVHDELVVPDLLSGRAPVVVDVGANVGQFTCATKLFAPDAQIRCFEPDPAVYQSLAANVAALDHVEPRCAGLGAKAETVPFFRHEISLMSTLRPSSAETYDPANTIDVDVLRLDDAVADLDAIDLVKIDVEGLELDVIEGGPRNPGAHPVTARGAQPGSGRQRFEPVGARPGPPPRTRRPHPSVRAAPRPPPRPRSVRTCSSASADPRGRRWRRRRISPAGSW